MRTVTCRQGPKNIRSPRDALGGRSARPGILSGGIVNGYPGILAGLHTSDQQFRHGDVLTLGREASSPAHLSEVSIV